MLVYVLMVLSSKAKMKRNNSNSSDEEVKCTGIKLLDVRSYDSV